MVSPQPAIPTQNLTTVVDAGRPWPGLFPFTEEQRQYFFGRDNEVEELSQCIKRDIITLLYSKSGLGKSSLLQAGLFPRLRPAGFLPVYIRLNYSGATGTLESQVKAALQSAIRTADLAEVASPGEDESLWEYLHRRGGNLIDDAGGVVCPVLVFDQFEEIFTLGLTNEGSRQLRDEFLACFADLVENTIPQELRDRLADNPKLAGRYDFSATGCRFVVSLREEYVTRLEGLRKVPSLAFASSRMHLQEMNGEQALLAVSQPNPGLVSQEVSELIVRFVAGASGPGPEPALKDGRKPLADLEVAPAILSLFCRELSIKRGDMPQITSALVTGNADTIIDDFYHRCVDDKPEPVHCLIEDQLVTELGYRDNIDLEDARNQLERVGIPSSMIDQLVNDRLLHIEDYRGTPRLELTHDVLLDPVKRSRAQRLEKEAEHRKHELHRAALEEIRRTQQAARARWIKRIATAAVGAALLLLAMFMFALRQKHQAQQSATQARLSANQARLSAEAERKANQQAQHNAEVAQKAKEEAQSNELSAEQERAAALKSADLAKNAERKAEAAMQAALAARKEADKKSEQLAVASHEMLASCDTMATVFRNAAEKESANATTVDLFRRLYEIYLRECVRNAKELHKADPDNLEVAEWLGLAPLHLTESAMKRKDKNAGHQYCNDAIGIADGFRKEPSYKSHLMAGRVYALTGFYLILYFDDSAAAPTADKGVQLAAEARSQRAAKGLDDWDWEQISRIYFDRAYIDAEEKNYSDALGLEQQSYDGANKAFALKPDNIHQKLAMDAAMGAAGDARKLNKDDLAKEWEQKFLVIAYAHVDSEEFYTDAIDALSKADNSPAKRKLIDLRIEALLKQPKELQTQRQLATAYQDSAILQEKMNDMPQAVADAKKAVDVLAAAKQTASSEGDKKDIATELAQAYGGLAWYEVQNRQPAEALRDARSGLQEDPSQLWIGVNEAHAMLFVGDIQQAKAKYLSLKDTEFGRRKLSQDIQNDFERLCEIHYTTPDMAQIAHDLGIKSAKLSTCFSSTTAGR